jgi:mono/diheme cytochrome c family protein
MAWRSSGGISHAATLINGSRAAQARLVDNSTPSCGRASRAGLSGTTKVQGGSSKMVRQTAPALGRMVSQLVLAGSLAACSAVTTESNDRFSSSGELIAFSGGDAGADNACVTCHGLDGRGNGGDAPRLSGLQLGYLIR